MAHLKKASNGHLLKNSGGHLVNNCVCECPDGLASSYSVSFTVNIFSDGTCGTTCLTDSPAPVTLSEVSPCVYQASWVQSYACPGFVASINYSTITLSLDLNTCQWVVQFDSGLTPQTAAIGGAGPTGNGADTNCVSWAGLLGSFSSKITNIVIS
jgi:hypothetical protein